MDDKILALLGDRSAQERITERGELLPCQCGGIAEFVFQKSCMDIRSLYSGM